MRLRYVYITTNILNGKQYIGQRTCPENKTIFTDIYFGSGTAIINAVRKYGKENFKQIVIGVCSTQRQVDIMEKIYINIYKAYNNKSKWYNINHGGQYVRSLDHSSNMSTIMKKFYSNPDNVDKAVSAGMGISIEQYRIYKIRKQMIKVLKKYRNRRKRKESAERNKRLKKERAEYFASDEYKNKIKAKRDKLSEIQRSDPVFKEAVRLGREKALKENPDIFKHLIPHKSKIQMSRSKVKNPTYLHKLLWENNLTLGMISSHYRNILKKHILGRSKKNVEIQVLKVSTILNKYDVLHDVEILRKEAYLLSEKREKKVECNKL